LIVYAGEPYSDSYSMRIAIVAPPFISVPPAAYGGTELFVAHLAHGLHKRGHEITVYANGDSRVRCELKWRYRHADWPVANDCAAQLKNADHNAWAIHDAMQSADVLHLNDIVGVPFSSFVEQPIVLTLHHPHEPVMSAVYTRYPEVHYVAISGFQARREPMPHTNVIHHGVPIEQYTFRAKKQDYLAFLGRMAPCKGAHLAIEAANLAGLPLKLAGEIQPSFQDYWDRQVAPLIDGDRIQYVGQADLACKNDLLSNARALRCPIQWDEPFGLVMIEAMACGTPVLALPGGSVAEIVQDGRSGWICRDLQEMAERAVAAPVAADSCRSWAAEHFSCERMVDRYLEIYERVLAGESSSAEATAGRGLPRVWKM
jgi:glycosyltransferase involved in cell wall biosynthesis